MPRESKERDPNVVTLKDFIKSICAGEHYWGASNDIKCQVIIIAASLGASLPSALTLVGESGRGEYWNEEIKEYLISKGVHIDEKTELGLFLKLYSKTRLLCVQMAHATEKRDGSMLKFLGECILNQKDSAAATEFLGTDITHVGAFVDDEPAKGKE